MPLWVKVQDGWFALFHTVWGFSWEGSDVGRLVWLALSLLRVSARGLDRGWRIQNSLTHQSGAYWGLGAGAPPFLFT